MVFLRLKELRLNEGLKQKDVSSLLRISREAYSQYETGKRQMTYESLSLLADYYKVSLDYLFGREERKPLTEEELALVDKYRILDGRGKNSVNVILQNEFELAQSQKKKQAT